MNLELSFDDLTRKIAKKFGQFLENGNILYVRYYRPGSIPHRCVLSALAQEHWGLQKNR